MPASTRKTSEPVQAAADGAKFVFFDLETTGLSPRGCRIIEMAALRVGPEGAIAGSFQALVRIDRPVPYFITKLTGITAAMLARGERIEMVFPRFCEFVGDLPLVAYNASFDMGFLRAEAARQRIKLANTPVCALAVARARVPGLPSYKLKAVAEHFGIQERQTHRALDDCEMGLRVFSHAMRSPVAQAASSAGPAHGITV
jgi:DNA polymerase III epsilon subunit family exonuclease